jgi:solute carrier family 66 (lysosomal lysine-arginine transporter), member 1
MSDSAQIILAVYYTIADIVLLGQCFYYRGFTWRDEVIPPAKPTTEESSERTRLLHPGNNDAPVLRERRSSNWSNVDATHLSPATPLLDARKPSDPPAIENQKPTTRLQATMFNTFAVLMVCAAGTLGWWISNQSQGGLRYGHDHSDKHPPQVEDDVLQFSLWGQIFGYFCAVLYLASRIPQILLNYRRKSTDGVSILFFLFACIGNLTYVLSIFAFDGKCQGPDRKCRSGEAASLYGRYILVNASWLAGSLGTLFLDLCIFVQFILYRALDEDESDYEESPGNTPENGGTHARVYDDRPLLQRDDSAY